jgi:hypothetical protein
MFTGSEITAGQRSRWRIHAMTTAYDAARSSSGLKTVWTTLTGFESLRGTDTLWTREFRGTVRIADRAA